MTEPTTEAPAATRVLYVSTSSTIGGAEKTLYTLATSINPKFFNVAGVVSLKAKGAYAQKLEAADRKVFSMETEMALTPWTLWKLARIIKETRPVIVHALMYQAMQAARIVKKMGLAQFSLVSSPRVSYRVRSRSSLQLDALLRSADDLLVTESEASRSHLTQKLGYDPKKVLTIHNGIDTAGWTISPAKRAELRAQLKLQPADILLGSAGRLDVQKGHAYLLEAVAKLRVTHPVHCVILGDGPLRRKLERLTATLKIEDCVHFLGEQPDLLWLNALDIFVLPSLWEGLPNALLEAMGLGLAVVATEVDGVPEAIDRSVSGLLCAPEDSQSLVTVIQDLIVDPALRKRVGDAARQKISTQFQLKDMLDAYENIYTRLAANRS